MKNTFTNKEIEIPSKAYYFLKNKVVSKLDGTLEVLLLAKDVLETKDEIREVISKYLPLDVDQELAVFTVDERYIIHYNGMTDNPTIEDILSYIK